MVYPAQEIKPGIELSEVVETLPVGEAIRLEVAGETLDGRYVEKTVKLPFDDKAVGAEDRISSMGLMLIEDKGKMLVDMVEFGSPAEASGIDFDWEIKSIVQKAERPMKEWVFVPTLLIVCLMGWNQLRRARKEQVSA
jgi:hypothetical protein